MRGAKAQAVNLSDAEQQGLEKLIKRHQVGQQIAKRARIVLAAAGGQKNKGLSGICRDAPPHVGANLCVRTGRHPGLPLRHGDSQ